MRGLVAGAAVVGVRVRHQVVRELLQVLAGNSEIQSLYYMQYCIFLEVVQELRRRATLQVLAGN